MPAMTSFLCREAEPVPNWLRTPTSEIGLDLKAFFNSRVVYYPGCDRDFHPLAVFGMAGAVHCFLMADHGMGQQQAEHRLDMLTQRPFPMRGLSLVKAGLIQLAPDPGSRHTQDCMTRWHWDAPPVLQGAFAIYELRGRHNPYPEDGPLNRQPTGQRLALLYLCTEGIAAYDLLFHDRPPYAVLLQDHGFGGNWDRFGAGGELEAAAERHGHLPEWLLVAENTSPWNGYSCVEAAGGDSGQPFGAWHDHVRHLHRRDQP